MLELRPSCEHCNRSLPYDSPNAMICTFECTYCTECAEVLLKGMCPNCGGNFTPRPIRPANLLEKYPVSQKVIHKPVDLKKHLERIKESR
ncbi:MAG: DUF1272 domain-containing protein [Bacteroidia bacterium]|nr:DUF1272 domain-containing protein [Bacteroidia bacterium]NNM22872.1 DUF1272 domain-containing protein [Flavobacteriaceae bacterium]